jgi:hypothetical protein
MVKRGQDTGRTDPPATGDKRKKDATPARVSYLPYRAPSDPPLTLSITPGGPVSPVAVMVSARLEPRETKKTAIFKEFDADFERRKKPLTTQKRADRHQISLRQLRRYEAEWKKLKAAK